MDAKKFVLASVAFLVCSCGPDLVTQERLNPTEFTVFVPVDDSTRVVENSAPDYGTVTLVDSSGHHGLSYRKPQEDFLERDQFTYTTIPKFSTSVLRPTKRRIEVELIQPDLDSIDIHLVSERKSTIHMRLVDATSKSVYAEMEVSADSAKGSEIISSLKPSMRKYDIAAKNLGLEISEDSPGTLSASVEVSGHLSDGSKLSLVRKTNILSQQDSLVTIPLSGPLRPSGLPTNEAADSGLVFVSLFKSVAGEQPKTELVDMFFEFPYENWFFTVATLDLAFSGSTDTASLTQEKFTDAGLSLNFLPSPYLFQFANRKLFIGGLVRIFNTVPYAGIHVGSIETSGSFASSFLTGGLLCPFSNPDTVKTVSTVSRIFQRNLFIEFALYSKLLPLKIGDWIRIKGSILIPLKNDSEPRPSHDDIQTRITLELPLGGIHSIW